MEAGKDGKSENTERPQETVSRLAAIATLTYPDCKETFFKEKGKMRNLKHGYLNISSYMGGLYWEYFLVSYFYALVI